MKTWAIYTHTGNLMTTRKTKREAIKVAQQMALDDNRPYQVKGYVGIPPFKIAGHHDKAVPAPVKKKDPSLGTFPIYKPHAFRTKAQCAGEYRLYERHHRNLGYDWRDAAINDPAARRHPDLKREWIANAQAHFKLADRAERAAERLES